jgi:hypothetical protein
MAIRSHGRRGALPPDRTKPRINFGPAIRGRAPSQAHFGHIPVIGMLGNDEWGDCVDAGAGHMAEALSFYGQGQEIQVTTAQALAMYSAVAGFKQNAGPPGNNPTDKGSTLQAGLEYFYKTGIAGIKIAAFGELEIDNTNQWQQALATLGPLMLGVGVGHAEEQAFDNGKPWTKASGAGRIQENHCVILSGYQPGMYWCYTWGGLQGITPQWFQANAWEVWGAVSQEWVSNVTGHDPEGVDLAVLGQQYSQVTGKPSPFS